MTFRTFTAAAAVLLFSSPNPIFAQYQSTTPIFQFRPDQSSTFKRLYFSGTSNVRLDRSKYHFVVKKDELPDNTRTFMLFIPREFYKRFKQGSISLCTMNMGGYLKKTKCLDQLSYQSSFDDTEQAMNITLDAPLENKTNIGFFAKLNNPMNSGMFQFNLMASKDIDSANNRYVGSWIVTVN
jgi:hypothetical protein|tara:strand:- start:225 stop:770 length:546 start_codon:yes stop_codon:yes gene_type:complete